MKYRRHFRLPRDVERELDEELAAHIALRAEALEREGVPPERARALALERFGDLGEAKRRLYRSARERDAQLRRREWLGSVWRDVVLTWRQARRQPGVTALTVATLALAIGLPTAVFTVLNGVLLRPLPFPAAERIMALQMQDSVGNPVERVSSENWLDWRDRATTLEWTAIWKRNRFGVATGGGADRVAVTEVTPAFFDVLGTRMLWGRGFAPGDQEARALIVSESYWRRALGATMSPDAELVVEGRPMRLVGVVPDAQIYPEGTEIWVATEPRRFGDGTRNNINWVAIARLADGVTPERARADLDAIARGIREAAPQSIYSWGVPLVPLEDFLVDEEVERRIWLLFGAVVLVLLIARANLAGLSLARSTVRTPEIALRAALGAGRRRVLRQLVTEHLVLAAVGGILGVVLAWWSTGALVEILQERLPRADAVRVDGTVLAFSAAMVLLAGIGSGLVPSWRVLNHAAPRSLLGGRGTVRGGRGLPGAALVAVQFGLAIVLLTGAGLLLRSFESLLSRDLGYDPEGVVTAQVALDVARYSWDVDPRPVFWDRLEPQLRALPGARAVAFANWIPTGTTGTGFIAIEGRPESKQDGAAYRVVSRDYFEAMRMPLLEGRAFQPTDRAGSGRVAVISRTMAQRYWPGESALGRRVKALSMEAGLGNGPEAEWITVIGVVGDVRHGNWEEDPDEVMYVLLDQAPVFWARSLYALVRGTPARAGALADAVRREIRDIDPLLASDIALLEDMLGGTLAERRVITSVLGAFGVIALALAAIGIYGLLSFSVARRTHEIGVRAALGATRGRILGMVLGRAVVIVSFGAAAGLLASFWVTRLLETQLVDVTPTDPLAFGLAVLVLAATALAAALLPALRAARLDPQSALRS